MSGVNKAIILGNLGRDPEVRFLASGKAVANFSLATTESWKDKDSGEKKEKTEWHRCSAWGKQAELIGEYCKKGDSLYVEGRIETREYEKDGVKKYSTEIQVQNFTFVGGKGKGGKEGGAAAADNASGGPKEDEDIPF